MVHVLPAAHHAVVVLLAAALVVAAQAVVTVAEVADKSQRKMHQKRLLIQGKSLEAVKIAGFAHRV